jgi:hypothetical protein
VCVLVLIVIITFWQRPRQPSAELARAYRTYPGGWLGLSARPSVCLPACPPVCPSVCPSVCLPWLFIRYNVQLSLVGQNAFTAVDPWAGSVDTNSVGEVDIDQLIAEFGNWAWNTQTAAAYNFDNAQLFSGKDFDGSTIGYAYVSSRLVSSWSGSGLVWSRLVSSECSVLRTS